MSRGICLSMEQTSGLPNNSKRHSKLNKLTSGKITTKKGGAGQNILPASSGVTIFPGKER